MNIMKCLMSVLALMLLVGVVVGDDCHNCNEWVGIGVGLATSFVTLVVVFVILIVTLLVKKLNRRYNNYRPIENNGQL